MSEDTEWVTVKVPRADKEKAKEYRPEGATFGDCLQAGAERLNEHLDSDLDASVTAEVTPVVDEDALEDAREELAEAVREAREQASEDLTPLEDIDAVHEDVRDVYALVETMNHKLDAIQEAMRG